LGQLGLDSEKMDGITHHGLFNKTPFPILPSSSIAKFAVWVSGAQPNTGLVVTPLKYFHTC